jgi:hypothetical protein
MPLTAQESLLALMEEGKTNRVHIIDNLTMREGGTASAYI